MVNRRELLERRYRLQFPDSFYAFWEFARTHSSLLDVLGDNLMGMALTGSGLVGPFEFLNESKLVEEDPLWDARYYNDPPEFLTIARGRTDGLHWGYYIDDPQSPTFPVVAYYGNDAFELTVVGDTLFEALRDELEGHYSGCLENIEYDPDGKDTYQRYLDQLARLRERLQTYATGERDEVGEEYSAKYHAMSGLSRRVIAPTRDGMGIVVPDGKYQPLNGDDPSQLWDYRPTSQEVQQRSGEALQLLAQGYPGAALKLGKDLWVYRDFRGASYALLDAAYANLSRELLREWLHMAVAFRNECDAKRPL
jgi:Uncharacterised conserved protein (DUF2228)